MPFAAEIKFAATLPKMCLFMGCRIIPTFLHHWISALPDPADDPDVLKYFSYLDILNL